MSGRFRAIVVVIGVAAIAFGVYRNNEHHPVHNTGLGGQVVVLVAKRPIQKGTTGDAIVKAHRVRPVFLQQAQLQPGALFDTRTLAGSVAVTNIARCAQLTSADFGPSKG